MLGTTARNASNYRRIGSSLTGAAGVLMVLRAPGTFKVLVRTSHQQHKFGVVLIAPQLHTEA